MRKYSIHFIVCLITILVGCRNSHFEDDSNFQDNEDKNLISPYCSAVLDYYYAPGQHAYRAAYPDYLNGDSCVTSILLGGWGGYVVMTFDHDVKNQDGEDVIVYCGSSVQPEPGVVYFMCDENGNELPDERWYEVRGSEFEKSNRKFQMTYYAPKDDTSNVTWRDCEGNCGELPKSSSWWWKEEDDSITFSGTLLPEAYYNSGDNEKEYWKIKEGLFLFGYAENGKRSEESALDYSNELKGNCFDISDLVDENGAAVDLCTIRFVKIQTGVFQQAGWLGEISTEINGMADLSMLK
jgi:hypothetical protein